MTRDEFLNRLGELLACLPADQVKETQEVYAEVIADRMEDGMTEAEAHRLIIKTAMDRCVKKRAVAEDIIRYHEEHEDHEKR